MAKGNLNQNLHNAKNAKKDEFYTQLTDIEKELRHYREQFKNKTILCNCDDPRDSNFFFFFYANFYSLGLKKLIVTCYKNLNPDLFSQNKDEQAVYCIYDGKDRVNDIIYDHEKFIKQNKWDTLKGNGDFRNQECIELLKQADIVVTNPPFSLFREYVAQLIEYDKKFLILGHQNAITYKECFSFIKDNKMWLGYSNGGVKWFQVPEDYDIQTETRIKYENGKKFFSMGSICWFTNLDVAKRREDLILYKKYNTKEYPKYDNYNAIEVSKVADIPCDYDGVMGVPITFVDKYNPKQFEIIQLDHWGEMGNLDNVVNGKTLYRRIYVRKKGRESK